VRYSRGICGSWACRIGRRGENDLDGADWTVAGSHENLVKAGGIAHDPELVCHFSLSYLDGRSAGGANSVLWVAGECTRSGALALQRHLLLLLLNCFRCSPPGLILLPLTDRPRHSQLPPLNHICSNPQSRRLSSAPSSLCIRPQKRKRYFAHALILILAGLNYFVNVAAAFCAAGSSVTMMDPELLGPQTGAAGFLKDNYAAPWPRKPLDTMNGGIPRTVRYCYVNEEVRNKLRCTIIESAMTAWSNALGTDGQQSGHSLAWKEAKEQVEGRNVATEQATETLRILERGTRQ
jgi:hypothetical protein